MRIGVLSILGFIAVALGATDTMASQKAIIVTFPAETPQEIVDKAMAAIKDDGGVITHEYTLIKGFAAKAPPKALESVNIFSNEHHATIEEDQMVSINE